MDIAEFILKMFTIGFLIAGILGMILQTINFQGQLFVYDDMRLAIDFANAAAAAPCLVENVGSDFRKGTLDSAKFESAKQNFCLELEKPYKLKITRAGVGEIFSVGTLNGNGIKPLQPMPVTIKIGEKYFAGVLNVEIGQ